jgi:hypothetical protein
VQSIHAGDGSTKTEEKQPEPTDFHLKLPAPFTSATGDGCTNASRHASTKGSGAETLRRETTLEAKGKKMVLQQASVNVIGNRQN